MANTKKGVEMSQAQGVSIRDLQDELKGEVIVPEDPGYDEARQVFFKGFDRRPLAVARVAGAEDVARVVDAAREGGLELAVRSGGHSRAGYGTSEGGLVIDLSGDERRSRSTPTAKTAWVETGITAGEYTTPTGEQGRVTGLGDTGSVGIGGITLAGGDRLPGPQERADDRRPARRRGGDRRRRGRRGERGLGAGPLLGDPRRREQLRRRHPLPAAPARDLGDRRRHDDPAGDARGDHRLPRGRARRRRRSSRPSPT